MSVKLYEYALIFTGRKDKEGGYLQEPELLDFERVLARDEAQATIIASRAIPETFMDQLERVEIAVRPF